MLAVTAINGTSQNVSINTAKLLAKNHYYQNESSETQINYTDIVFSGEYLIKNGNDTLYFIFNVANNNGFIIISADQRAYPIIGYSYVGSYSTFDQPTAFSEWMENIKQELIFIKANNIPASNSIAYKWNELKTVNSGTKAISEEPLLQTTWNQGCYYNSSCPADAAGPCDHVLVGCTATSTAQIMKYWSYPSQGTGSHSYNCPPYGTLTANFGATTYNWANMPNNIFADNSDLATLLFHCGVSVDMAYGPNASSAYDPLFALINYFNYSSNAQYIFKSNYSSTQWENLLKTEIDSLRPIWYRGDAGYYGGHAFVCDGYQNTNYFHFNWGWSGAYDGYYYLSNLNPGGGNFNNNQAAIIKIYPSIGAFAFTKPASDIGITNAILHGIVKPNGFLTTVSFEYGTTSVYGNTIAASQSPVNGNSNVLVDVNISGLLPNTIYHFRVKASNASGTFYSADMTFSTKNDIWIEQVSGTTSFLETVFFVNSNVGYVVGDGGIILKTINGGVTWNSLNSGIANDLIGVYFLNLNVGWAVGYGGKILKTTNGGTTWIIQTSGTSSNLYSVRFIDANNGWAGSDSKILKTINGGASWTSVYIGGGGSYPIYSLFFTSPSIGYAAGWYISMLYTNNGGSNWYTSTTNPNSNGLTGVHFPSTNIGFSCGANGYIYKITSNTWNLLASGTTNYLASIYFTDNNTGYTVGDGGIILKTVNGGTNWVNSLSGTGYYLSSVFFSDTYNGWAVGDNGVILHTRTGGEPCSNVTIINQPDSVIKCVGETVTFSITVSGIAPTYQWEKNEIDITGANNSSFSISNVALSDTGNYTCYISNPCSYLTSDVAKLTVNPLPGDAGAITGITTVCQGQNSVNYTVPLVADATSYLWTLPSGSSGTSMTNSITVNYGTAAGSTHLNFQDIQ